jgi:hypothetical protein
MLDPLSAIGVAAAAFQFASSGVHFLKLCRQVHAGSDCAIKAHRELEATVNKLGEVIQSVQAAGPTASASRVNAIAAECLALSSELKKLLLEIHATNRVSAAWRALRQEDKIERMKDSLMEKQNLLHITLTTDIR